MIHAFYNAFRGLTGFFSTEKNGRIQFAIALATIAVSLTLPVSMNEWMAILLCIALVLSLEMMNSALEKLCDLVEPAPHPAIKVIKDMAAGAVLWASVMSALTGMLILLPKIFALLGI